MTNKILVLGSSNVDFILRIPRFHNPGETITGESLVTAFGGKGAKPPALWPQQSWEPSHPFLRNRISNGS
jgi:hypothetical protein